MKSENVGMTKEDARLDERQAKASISGLIGEIVAAGDVTTVARLKSWIDTYDPKGVGDYDKSVVDKFLNDTMDNMAELMGR